MNRLFHARIQPASYVLMAIILCMTLYAMWERMPVLIVVLLLLLVVVIERVIHTTYTITSDNRLLIHTGRYSKDKTVPLADIRRLERISAMRFFGKSFRSFVYIECAGGRVFSLIPTDEAEFVKCIEKRLLELTDGE